MWVSSHQQIVHFRKLWEVRLAGLKSRTSNWRAWNPRLWIQSNYERFWGEPIPVFKDPLDEEEFPNVFTWLPSATWKFPQRVREKGKKSFGVPFSDGAPPPTVASTFAQWKGGDGGQHDAKSELCWPVRALFQQKPNPFFPDLFSSLGFSPDGSPGEMFICPGLRSGVRWWFYLLVVSYICIFCQCCMGGVVGHVCVC